MTRKSLLAAAVAALAIASALACGGGSTGGGSTDAGSSIKADAATTNIPADASSQQQIPPDASTQQIPPDASTTIPDDASTTIPDDASTTIPDDAGTTIDPDGGTTTGTSPLSTCGTAPAAANSLTVKVGSTTLNFSNAPFTVSYDESFGATLFALTIPNPDMTAGNNYLLEVDVYDDFKGTMCPQTYTLPHQFSDNISLYLYTDDFAEFYGSDDDGSNGGNGASGSFTLTSFDPSGTSGKVAFSCTNCVLGDYDGTISATVSGSYSK